MSATEDKIQEVVKAAERYGTTSMIALAGVPGTGKSYLGRAAADRVATHKTLVYEMPFHPAVTYDRFMEGMLIDSTGATTFVDGPFKDWNDRALRDPENIYVFLIEELTRTNVPAVLGELMTYVEHRDRYFETMYSRTSVHVAENLRILATFNPIDRSALNLDAALFRRLRIIDFPPDPGQLRDMLAVPERNLPSAAIEKLVGMFEKCKEARPAEFDSTMPFGHGIFDEVTDERPDLHDLWNERLVKMLRRPLFEPDPFFQVVQSEYPWTDPAFES